MEIMKSTEELTEESIEDEKWDTKEIFSYREREQEHLDDKLLS